MRRTVGQHLAVPHRQLKVQHHHLSAAPPLRPMGRQSKHKGQGTREEWRVSGGKRRAKAKAKTVLWWSFCFVFFGRKSTLCLHRYTTHYFYRSQRNKKKLFTAAVLDRSPCALSSQQHATNKPTKSSPPPPPGVLQPHDHLTCGCLCCATSLSCSAITI